MDGEELTQIEDSGLEPEDSGLEPAEELSEDEEDESMPFPNARVVRLLREEIQSGKQIRSEVKVAVNEWLGSTLRRISREMDGSPYGSICLADFSRATRPFDMIDHLVKDKDRLMLAIDKLISDADQIKRDLQRFYTNLTGKEQQEL